MKKTTANYTDAFKSMSKRQLFSLCVRMLMNAQLISREDAHYKIYQMGRDTLTSQQRQRRELIK